MPKPILPLQMVTYRTSPCVNGPSRSANDLTAPRRIRLDREKNAALFSEIVRRVKLADRHVAGSALRQPCERLDLRLRVLSERTSVVAMWLVP